MDWYQIVGLVLLVAIPLSATYFRFQRNMDRRVTDVEGRLDLGQQRFSHIDDRFEQVEKKIDDVADRNAKAFDRIEGKLDRVIDHLLTKE